MEEFQEPDILWPENECDKEANSVSRSAREGRGTQRKLSDPIKIPSRSASAISDSCNVEDDNKSSDGNVIPPHVIVARRMTEKMAFSVCIGNGRTLKGRDLSRVRNSILQTTGFLET
ncbi:unnamed protein product, partial [Musa hybrid cultivar]